MTQLFDSKGKSVSLGQQLGKGGEGTVYEIPTMEGAVAKIYHEAVPFEKQEKLRGMVKGHNEQLGKFTTWPLDTLHQGSAQGTVCGFLMEKAIGYEPLHHFYSPTDRKQRFPEKDWAFLVHVARNTATAFYAIHHYGHVIGDVNPNFVFAANNGLVKLIDCDSFQVVVDNTYHLCEVGVPHFTPPELQSCKTFRGVQRSPNHDNFGLALLIFHVLMMGRHPFSGVPTSGEMPALEKAIEKFYYAFGKNALSKGIKPPPNTVTSLILPDSVTTLFECAFTEQGIHGKRPSAHEWIEALDALRQQLSVCGQVSSHKYFRELRNCPWCELEQRSGIIFFVYVVTATNGQNTFDLVQVWAKITAVPSPGPQSIPAFPVSTVKSKEIPTELITLRVSVQTLKISIEKTNRRIKDIKVKLDKVQNRQIDIRNNIQISLQIDIKAEEEELLDIQRKRDEIQEEQIQVDDILAIGEKELADIQRKRDEIQIEINNLSVEKSALGRVHTKNLIFTAFCALLCILTLILPIPINIKGFSLILEVIMLSSLSTFLSEKKDNLSKLNREIIERDMYIKDLGSKYQTYQQGYNLLLERKAQIKTELDSIDEVYQQKFDTFSEKKAQIKKEITQISTEIEQKRRSLEDELAKETKLLQEMNRELTEKKQQIDKIAQKEKQFRWKVLDYFQSQLKELKDRWNLETGDEDFQKKLKELSDSQTQYEDLLKQLAQEKQKLKQNAYGNQLNKFLSRYLIKDYDIQNIGTSRKATLASFGIETAADIEKSKIMMISGFGEQLAGELVKWRDGLKKHFVFDPSKGIDPKDNIALNQRFALKMKQLESALLAGPEQLTQIREQILKRRDELLPEIQEANQLVIQAVDDLRVFK